MGVTAIEKPGRPAPAGTSNLYSGPTRALLVQPRFSGHSFWNYTEVCRLTGARYPAAPLGLLTVAALMPGHWRFRLVDENVRPLRPADLDWADIVLTGGMLPQQAATLAVMARARAAGKPVVLGGPDPTEQPELYEGADYLVLGEGELTIPMFLADLARGVSSGVYRSDDKADMTAAVVPRFDLIRFRNYIQVGIQFSRGCPYNCEFCDIIELFGRRPRTKTPAQVIAELQALYDLGYRGHIDFVDDNLIGNRAKALEVLAAIADWSRRHGHPFYFSTEASVNLAAEPGLLGLMRECDFRYVFLGIESPDDRVLAQVKKTQNIEVSVPDAVRTLASYGMIVNGGFILGFDEESPEAGAGIIRLIEEAGICLAMVGALYALPKTRLTRRLEAEGRLFDRGRKTVDALLDIDQTTSGLNFATARPRAAILEDQARVISHIYRPAHYYEKVLLTALNLKPARRHRPGFRESLRLALAFLRVSYKAGFNRRTNRLYWKTLFLVLARNPAAIDSAVNLAAMYLHFAKQSYYVVGALNRAARRVRRVGEERYNAVMVAGPGPGARAGR
ncbi:MAG: B12-binding domain-containing radical SAM protein [bacterium]